MQDKLAAQAKKNHEMLAELSKKQEERQKAEQEAAIKAHQQAILARKLQAANQAADHKRRLEARRAQFTSEFGHVWVNGPTEIYIAQMTVADRGMADKIIDNLFFENVVADARTFKAPVTKSYLKSGHQIVEDGEHNIVMITHNDRTKDLLKTVQTTVNNDKFDLVFIPISTGNRNYIEWVSDQTVTRSAALANLKNDDAEVPDDQLDAAPQDKAAKE